MGQKVNPTGYRVGITEDWKSKWYAPKAAYGDFLVEDFKIRKLIDKKLNRKPPFAGISDILIERTREEVVRMGRSAVFNLARARQVLGYEPKVNVNEGMKELAAWAHEVGGAEAIARGDFLPFAAGA